MSGWGKITSVADDLLIQRKAQDGGQYSIHRGRTHPQELLICRDGKSVYTCSFSSPDQFLVDFCVTLSHFGILLNNPVDLIFIPREDKLGLERHYNIPLGLRKFLSEEQKLLALPEESRPDPFYRIQMQLGHIGDSIMLIHSDLAGYLYSFLITCPTFFQAVYSEIRWQDSGERFQLTPRTWFRSFHHRPGSDNSDLVFFEEYRTDMYEFYTRGQIRDLCHIPKEHYTQYMQSLDIDKRVPRYLDGDVWNTQWQYESPNTIVQARHQIPARPVAPAITFPLEWVQVQVNGAPPATLLEMQNGIQMAQDDIIKITITPTKHCTNITLHSFAPVSWRLGSILVDSPYQSILEIPWLPMNQSTEIYGKVAKVNLHDLLKLHIQAEIW